MKGERVNTTPIFYIVLAVLAVEFFALPHGFSLYRLFVAPLCFIGSVFLLGDSYRKADWFGLVGIGGIVVLMGATSLWTGSRVAMSTAIGLVPFVTYMHLYLVRHPIDRTAVKIIAWYSVPHAITLFLYWAGVSGEAYSKVQLRFDGLHEDPNFLCIYVIVAVAAKLVLLSSANSFWRVTIIASLVLDVAMVLLSVSRGGMVALVVTFLVWLYLVDRRRLIAFAIPISVVVVMLLPQMLDYVARATNSPVAMLVSRFDSGDLTSSDDNIRLFLWERAFEAIKGSGPFLGYSLDAFIERNGHYPHNTILDAALGAGPIGGVLLALIMILAGGKLLQSRRLLVDSNRLVPLMCAGIWSTSMFLSFFPTKLFWLSLIMTVTAATRLRDNKTAG